MQSKVTSTTEETVQIAKQFVQEEIVSGMVVCMTGELGAGKTTFTQGILREFEAQGPYTSPTFNIIKEYDVNKYNIKKIYHIDAYRIKSADMELIGWTDILNDEAALTVIEWPENIIDVLPQNTYMILCEWISEKERKYTFNY
jgi:tRNA threonylcarbamoyladenosine biosynthesis protein TsaE